MADIGVAADIDAPVDRVWSVIEHIDRHIDWMADAESIEFHGDQRRGTGTAFTCVTRIGPVRLRDEMTITDWEPGARMGVRHEGVVTGVGALLLDPIDIGRRTRVRWEETLDFPWYLGGVLGEQPGRLVLGAIWRSNLGRLRDLVKRTGSMT